MEPQIDFEGIRMVWAVAFLLDIINAGLLFVSLFKGINRQGIDGIIAWLAWWFCVDAITLIINEVLGPMNPFSYHQIGIVTGIALFSGFSVYMGVLFQKNWWMTRDDWAYIEEVIKYTQIKKRMEDLGADTSVLPFPRHGLDKRVKHEDRHDPKGGTSNPKRHQTGASGSHRGERRDAQATGDGPDKND